MQALGCQKLRGLIIFTNGVVLRFATCHKDHVAGGEGYGYFIALKLFRARLFPDDIQTRRGEEFGYSIVRKRSLVQIQPGRFAFW